mmetsp:Transcript_13578/g.34146  ORF Transcript_13578/g.34146 Transcript_13578/m.34146 type:complete len:278 (-) Transcript_13578:181-1014(-)
MHTHDNFSYNEVWQAIQNPTLECMEQIWGYDTIAIANPLDSQSHELGRGRDHHTLAHLGQFSGNVKWNLALAGNALGLVFRIERTGKLFDKTLGTRILGQKRQIIHGRSRGDVHNSPLFALQHTRENHSCHPDCAVDVHRHQALNFVILKFVEEHWVTVADTNVVYQHTNFQTCDNLSHLSLGSFVKFGVIANQIINLNSIILLFDLLLDVLQFGFSTTDQKNTHSFLGKSESISLSNSIGSSSDHGPFSVLFQVFRRTKECFVDVRDRLQSEIESR